MDVNAIETPGQRAERLAIARRILDSPYALGVIYGALKAAEVLRVEECRSKRKLSQTRILFARMELDNHLNRRICDERPMPETEEGREAEMARIMNEMWKPTPRLRAVPDL